MRSFVPCLLLLSVLQLAGGTLHLEALEFLERLNSRGYSAAGIYSCRLQLLKPCTISVYPPADSPSGFYAALGGNNILDLDLRVEGEGWFLEDTMPDDLPVLEVDSIHAAGGRRIIVRARDMLRGEHSDSTVVIWAFLPVDRN